MAPENAVYCTLLLSDSFLPGAMVLAHSLRDAGTAARLAVLYTPGTLQPETIAELESTYNDLIPVPPIANTTTPASLFLINRPDLITTFTKVELWRQTQFQRIVYLDADVLALRAPDELLSLSLPSTGTGEKRIAAAPDTGWPDCFNSGVMVLTPNMADYHALRDRAERGVTYDGADQGLLNMYFGEEGWERLRFGYNCTASRIPGTPAGAGVSVGSGAGVGAGSQYQYLPAYRQFAGSVSLAHFVGAVKPWSATRAQRREERGEVYDELVGRWWEVYHRCYRPNRTVSGVGGHGRGQEHVFETSTEGKPHPSYPGESDAHGHDLGLHVDNPESTLPEEHTRTGPTPSSVSLEHLEPAEEHDGHSPTFNPPIAEWDASRYVNPPTAIHPSTPVLKSKREPPPANTKPEGIALQQQTYRMSTDTRLFQPEPYPAIPQTVNINTSVLATPEPGKIAPIFPWEGRAPKPTRVFASSTAGSSAPTFTTSTSVEGPGQSPDKDTPPAIDPETKIEQQPSPPSWQTHTHSNAWDEVPGIQQYVQSVEDARARPAREAQRRTDATTTTATNSNTHEDVWSESRLLSSDGGGDGGGDGDEGTSHTSLSSAGGLRQKTGMDALDDWISVTADGFWDLVRVAYLYWAFVNVGRGSGCQPTS